MNAPPCDMDFETSHKIVDRLREVLQGKRHIGGCYIALEWIGSWTLNEVIRALFLNLAWRYREDFPMSRQSADFNQYATIVDGVMASVLGNVFPMSELAVLERANKHSPEWWDAAGVASEKALIQCQWDIEMADSFAGWLKCVDPSYDDYLPMVNHHINKRSPHLSA